MKTNSMGVFRVFQELRANIADLKTAEEAVAVLAYKHKCLVARAEDIVRSLCGKVVLHADQDKTTAYWIDEFGDIVDSAPCVYTHEIERQIEGGGKCQ